jgi:hypothetical protein
MYRQALSLSQRYLWAPLVPTRNPIRRSLELSPTACAALST